VLPDLAGIVAVLLAFFAFAIRRCGEDIVISALP
jgi:hypothetical protein